MAALAGLCAPACADGIQPPASQPRFEAWMGAQAFDRVWSLYTGLTAAPFSGIRQDGLRVRVTGAYSAYRYTTQSGINILGSASLADLLIGYHKQVGPLTLKAFGGLMVADHQLAPDDPAATIRGPGAGAKVALEAWWAVSERAWAALDLSWGSLHDSYGARTRLGWRLVPALSAGVEAEAAGNDDCNIARAGGFLRYEWASGELSLSSDKLLDDARRANLDASVPYAAMTWLTRF